MSVCGGGREETHFRERKTGGRSEKEVGRKMKLLLFAGSVFGWVSFLRTGCRIPSDYIPVTLISGCSLILYMAGLADLLEPAAYVFCAAGLVPGIFCAVRMSVRDQTGRRRAPSVFGICFLSGTLLFAAVIFRLHLRHYDNFSHWAAIVKYLLTAGKFPGADTGLIAFPDYPPGSSLFLYYVCTFLGKEQKIMLLAQNSIVFACFLALFGMIREKRRFLTYGFLSAGCTALSYLNLTVRINNLLVDFLLPLLVLASFSVTSACEISPRKAAFLQALILGFTGIVKNTGIVFALPAFLYFVWSTLRKRKGSRAAVRGVLAPCAAAVFLPYLFWKEHIRISLAGYESKFALDGTSAGMDAAVREKIIRDFLEASTDLSDRAAQVFLLCNAAVFAVWLWLRLFRHRKWRILPVLAAADILTVLYYGGILGMYLYSMPEEEAVRLAGFDRYACSFMVLFAGILLLSATRELESSYAVDIDTAGAFRAYSSPAAKRRYQYAVLGVLIIAVNFLYSEINGLLAVEKEYGTSLPGIAEQVITDRWYPDGKPDEQKYLVAATDRNSQVSNSEVMYVCRYFLSAPYVDVTADLSQEDYENAVHQYDYIIVLEPEAVSDRVKEKNPLLSEPGIYKTAPEDPALAGSFSVPETGKNPVLPGASPAVCNPGMCLFAFPGSAPEKILSETSFTYFTYGAESV